MHVKEEEPGHSRIIWDTQFANSIFATAPGVVLASSETLGDVEIELAGKQAVLLTLKCALDSAM